MLDLILSVDEAVLRLVLSWPHPVWVNFLMLGASYTGVAGALWLCIGVVLAGRGTIRPGEFARLVVAIALVHLVVDVIVKPWLDRPRPPEAIAGLTVGMAVPDSRSFPSGHAANAIAAAYVLHVLWRQGRPFVWTAAAIVATARVYLGVHYPVDAVAGSIAGLACGWVALAGRRERSRSD